MKHLLWIIVTLCLAACMTSAQSATVTAQDVVDKFIAAGLEVSDVNPGERTEGSPLPNSYKEHLEFAIAEVAPKGGQIFVCAPPRKNCDALYQYFNILIGLAGPYTYQSPSGLVVAQLNSGLTPETAAKFEEVIKGLP